MNDRFPDRPAIQRLCVLLDNPQPVSKQKKEAVDEQSHPRHDRVTVTGTEPDHEKGDTDFRCHLRNLLVLSGEEEVTQGTYEAQDNDRA